MTSTTTQPTPETGAATAPVEGPVAWYEVQVPDLERATAFYTAVFGATAQPWEQYVMLLDGTGRPFAALERSDVPPPEQPAVRVYFQAPDLEAALAAVVAAGGSVEHERALISEEFGWWALARDPFGHWLGLCTDRPAAG
jgi:predicted enzyme related to lactoylglutathione lyase